MDVDKNNIDNTIDNNINIKEKNNEYCENTILNNKIIETELQSTDNLNKIKQIIEKMDKVHHIEILKLLSKQENVNFNENNNGTFINLTDLKDDTILKLQNYIEYFKKQQLQLINLEEQKKQIENYYF